MHLNIAQHMYAWNIGYEHCIYITLFLPFPPPIPPSFFPNTCFLLQLLLLHVYIIYIEYIYQLTESIQLCSYVHIFSLIPIRLIIWDWMTFVDVHFWRQLTIISQQPLASCSSSSRGETMWKFSYLKLDIPASNP